jgi:quinoprotein glucose dehydrogenase
MKLIHIKTPNVCKGGNRQDVLSFFPFFSAMLLFVVVGCTSSTDSKNQHLTWKDYGGGPDQSKYMELDQITKENVKDLKVAWFYPTGDNKRYEFNPLIVDGVMYVLAKNSSLVALNADTGEEIWIHANLPGIARRGINYWESEDKKDRRLIFQINNYLQEIDAVTGKSILTFGDKGLVDLREELGRDPLSIVRVQSGTPGKIFENLLLIGSGTGESYMSTPGYLRAYDVITGKLAWKFSTIPQPGEFGYETWPKDAYKYVGGVNTWGEISVDEDRGIAYFPLGSPTYDFYGADRLGSNLYGNCILALNARTGERIWHFQTVHHDLFDYDLTSAPQLLTVNHDGKKIDIVAVATKQGFLFVFDRVTGKPIWPIEERKVPASHVPGEEAWPTQPFPTVLPPISRQKFLAEDINTVFLTEEEQVYWKSKIGSMQQGLFTPLSNRLETLSMPGAVGGVNWGNTASNPKKGMMYIIAINKPSFYDSLLTRAEIEEKEAKSMGLGNSVVYVKNCQACHGADLAGLSAPTLLGINNRLNLNDFKQVVISGRGEMPAFPALKDSEIEDLYKYVVSSSRRASMRAATEEESTGLPSGPVVASGGVSGGLDKRIVVGVEGKYGAEYPVGVTISHERLYLQGYGLGYPFVIGPPWSELVAYDLNKGVIKWRRALGQDLEASKKGFENTGMLDAQRNGMVITSTGIVFSTAKDGKVYAFDADNGEELWSAQLPKGSEGLPAMYEVNGRQFLVVTATSSVKFGRGEGLPKNESNEAKGGYIVFSLPK